jgi:hypothetical protein
VKVEHPPRAGPRSTTVGPGRAEVVQPEKPVAAASLCLVDSTLTAAGLLDGYGNMVLLFTI